LIHFYKRIYVKCKAMPRKIDNSCNVSVPCIMPQQIDWSSLHWKSEDWIDALKYDKIRIRIGDRSPEFRHPQWERFTEVI